jgi:hypothetical protein
MPTVAKSPEIDVQDIPMACQQKKSNSVESSTARVCVGVRIRPLGPKESHDKFFVTTSSNAPNSIKLLNNNKSFT